jgi:hypothetical protein
MTKKIIQDESKSLIDRLAEELKPVRVTSLPLLAVQYFVSLAVLGFLFFLIFGFTLHIFVGVLPGELLLSLLIFTLVIASSSFLLAQSSRSGLRVSSRARFLFTSFLGAVILVELMEWFSRSRVSLWGPAFYGGWICSSLVLTVSAAAVGVLVYQVRRESPVKLREAAASILLSAGALGALVLQIHCPNENPVHQLLWHMILPISILLLFVKLLSSRALRW